MSGHGIKVSLQGHLPTEEHKRRDLSGNRMKVSLQGALTNWRVQSKRLVRTWKESKSVRGTYHLEYVEQVIYQNIQRKRTLEKHLLPGEQK